MTHPTPRQIAGARRAVTLLFLTLGTLAGAWAARIPAVKHALTLTNGQLGYALLALTAGLVAGMHLAGRLTDRLGSARLTTPAAVTTCLTVSFPGYAPTLPLLIAALALYGAVNACLDVSMNAHGVDVERARGRPLMSSLHGAYSIGGLAGAGIGGLCAHLGLGAGATLTATGLPLALACLRTRRHLLPPTRPATPHHPLPRPRWSGWLLLAGSLAFAGLVGEGAAADWTAVYLFENLHASQSVAVLGFAAFTTAMTAGRLAADRLALRLGPVRLIRYSGLLAATGLGTALLIGRLPAALAGFTLFGLGLAPIVPQIFSAAGNRDPAHAGQAIARVAAIGYTGLVVGPVVIGATATLTGLPTALAIPAALAAFTAACATALTPDGHRPQPPA